MKRYSIFVLACVLSVALLTQTICSVRLRQQRDEARAGWDKANTLTQRAIEQYEVNARLLKQSDSGVVLLATETSLRGMGFSNLVWCVTARRGDVWVGALIRSNTVTLSDITPRSVLETAEDRRRRL
jgi:hypothetical protein